MILRSLVILILFRGLSKLPINPIVVPFWGSYVEPYKVIPKRIYYGAHGYVYFRGSEFPNSRVSGPQIHTLNGFGTLKPYYLGTWTLRVLYSITPQNPILIMKASY